MDFFRRKKPFGACTGKAADPATQAQGRRRPPLKSGGRSALVDPLCAQARGSLEKDNDGCVGATKPYPTIFAPTSVTLGGQTGLLDGLRAKVDVACGNDIKTLTDNFSPRTGVESLLREPAPAGPRDPQRPPAIPRDPMPTPAANINTGERNKNNQKRHQMAQTTPAKEPSTLGSRHHLFVKDSLNVWFDIVIPLELASEILLDHLAQKRNFDGDGALDDAAGAFAVGD